MIVILDYGMGNVGSIQNMIRKIGCRDVIISRDPIAVENADKLILPGVGAFDMGMESLERFGLIPLIRAHALEKGRPLLGICLGMQLLGERSEEGNLPGLGLLPFRCVRFAPPADSGLKVPHMGWDRTYIQADTPLTAGLEAKERYYYVHSYHAVCEEPSAVLMTCDYDGRFPSALYHGSVYGVQFHPEKSHLYGMKLLKNFVERC